MKTHDLKTDSEVFASVRSGEKTFEIRFNDRDFQVGDTLNLRETKHTGLEMKNGEPLVYTGSVITKRVTYILRGPIYGLGCNWVIMSIDP